MTFIDGLIEYQKECFELQEHTFIAHQYPYVLYKYLSIENAIKALRNGTMRFSSPLAFNDPFELDLSFVDIHIDLEEKRMKLSNAVASRYNDPSLLSEYVNSYTEQEFYNADLSAIKAMKDNALILCTSRINNNSLMWSHYANKHTGICIGIRMPTFYEAEDGMMLTMNMNYVDKINKLRLLSGDFTDRSYALYTWITTKSKIWEYEQEVRSFIPNPNGKIPLDNYFGYNVKLDPSQFCEIHFGAATSKEDIDKITLLARNYNIEKWSRMENNNGTLHLTQTEIKI